MIRKSSRAVRELLGLDRQEAGERRQGVFGEDYELSKGLFKVNLGSVVVKYRVNRALDPYR